MKQIALLCTDHECGHYLAYDAAQPEVMASGFDPSLVLMRLIRGNQEHFGIQVVDVEREPVAKRSFHNAVG